ncbi:hypothetical protein ES695_18565 [Candidatus Atribacteria bacterium 1244-E10-H5-B2]|nr:MAG: hypothetical protein ES695_18565 [Candidatus Atribacteria bacterium 1244-E10-H5-B2]
MNIKELGEKAIKRYKNGESPKEIYQNLVKVRTLLSHYISRQVWRCNGSPKGSSSFFACSQKMPPAPALISACFINI